MHVLTDLRLYLWQTQGKCNTKRDRAVDVSHVSIPYNHTLSIPLKRGYGNSNKKRQTDNFYFLFYLLRPEQSWNLNLLPYTFNVTQNICSLFLSLNMIIIRNANFSSHRIMVDTYNLSWK